MQTNLVSPSLLIWHLVVSVEHSKYYWPPKPEGPEEEEVEEVEDEEEEEEREEAEAVELDEQVRLWFKKWDDEQRRLKEEEAANDVNVPLFYDRLPELFKRTSNLETLGYHNYPGLAMLNTHVDILAAHERLRTFGVDCAIRETSWRSPLAFVDPENWDIEGFIMALGPAVTSGTPPRLPNNAKNFGIARRRTGVLQRSKTSEDGHHRKCLSLGLEWRGLSTAGCIV
ncbi:hypothetical protein B0H10DRAFT_916561 [Mycena sp. CBHHK59/15]|nr:hypothetical protein B0H10DRAFT_916561 [Mycena sp. CBHHK59/15]